MKAEFLEAKYRDLRADKIKTVARKHNELQEYVTKKGGQLEGAVIKNLPEGLTHTIETRLHELHQDLEMINVIDDLIEDLKGMEQAASERAQRHEIFYESNNDVRLANQYQCDSGGCLCMHKILQNVNQGRVLNSVPKEAERAKSIARLMTRRPELF
jgi:hypothetical protein